MTQAKKIETRAGIDVLHADITAVLVDRREDPKDRIEVVLEALHKTEKLLTTEEQEIVSKLGDCASMFAKTMRKIHGDNWHETHPGDSMEFVSAIHVCQNMVLARAAARAYPIDYRL